MYKNFINVFDKIYCACVRILLLEGATIKEINSVDHKTNLKDTLILKNIIFIIK